MAWTEERVELLSKLWAEGLSASQIARTLGEATRNAVIGKIHRLGLSGRATPARTERPRLSSRRKPMSKPVIVVPEIIKEVVLEDGQYATVLTLKEHMCKWPIGHPGTEAFHFCARKTEGGVSYCEAHARLAYQTVPSRRERREEQKRQAQRSYDAKTPRRATG